MICQIVATMLQCQDELPREDYTHCLVKGILKLSSQDGQERERESRFHVECSVATMYNNDKFILN